VERKFYDPVKQEKSAMAVVWLFFMDLSPINNICTFWSIEQIDMISSFVPLKLKLNMVFLSWKQHLVEPEMEMFRMNPIRFISTRTSDLFQPQTGKILEK